MEMLGEKVRVGDHQYFDMHFYKMAVYSKLQSLITSMVLDVILGVLMFFVITAYTKEILDVLHYFGQFLHIEVLQRQVGYLMRMPAGFKPNPNLDNFIGNLVLDIIGVWNYVTTELTIIEVSLARYFGLFGLYGLLGLSFQLSMIHDYLFLTSVHIFTLYTGFCAFYKLIL